MKNKLKKLVRPAFCVFVVASLLFIPFPYSFLITAGALFSATAVILAVDFIDNKKQSKQPTQKEIPFEEYKQDKKAIHQKAMEIEPEPINGINYKKNSELQK